jgi:hypothetical protein
MQLEQIVQIQSDISQVENTLNIESHFIILCAHANTAVFHPFWLSTD